MIIIPINGKARHGKDTFAELLKNEFENLGKRVLIIRYADYLKFLAKEYFGWNGEKDEKGRTILQHIGTDRVRKKFENFWIEKVSSVVWMFEEDFDVVIIPDARFPNEASKRNWRYYERYFGANKEWNVHTVRVVRPDFDNGLTDEQKSHPSETSLDDYEFDFVFVNDSLDKAMVNAHNLVDTLIGLGD